MNLFDMIGLGSEFSWMFSNEAAQHSRSHSVAGCMCYMHPSHIGRYNCSAIAILLGTDTAKVVLGFSQKF